MGGAQSQSKAERSESSSVSSDGDEESVDSPATQDSKGSSGSLDGLLSQREQTYAPPSSPVRPLAHYIFLVHGYLGNDLEMGALSLSFRGIISPVKDSEDRTVDTEVTDNGDSSGNVEPPSRRRRGGGVQERETLTHERAAAAAAEGVVLGGGEAIPEIVVHSVKCNVGRTHDGIRNGGTRLAREIVDFVRKDVDKRVRNEDEKEKNDDDEKDERAVTYSIVGNSLGGLYARYAVSLLPYRLPLHRRQQQQEHQQQQLPPPPDNLAPPSVLNLHPNVFYTTATPHLGVSRHTYLPLPRIAETVIGAGMGTTGRDLFRLNSDKSLANAAAGTIVGAARGGVGVAVGSLRRSAAGADSENNADDMGDGLRSDDNEEDDDHDHDDAECIIRSMCLEERYLAPLRRFRRRVAYANAYGTDFQVPTETAAFLHEGSGVGHFLVASRHLRAPPGAGRGREGGAAAREGSTGEERGGSAESAADASEEHQQGEGGPPPFVVAVVRTASTPRPQSHHDSDNPDELLRMSQSLDALGWTKVLVDVRDSIPMPHLAKPAWLRPAWGSLDDLLRERAGARCQSPPPPKTMEGDTIMVNSSGPTDGYPGAISAGECILTSRELALSARAGDTLNFPLGHTVMIANSKSEGYTKVNGRGRPVMDRLAEDMVHDVLEVE